MRSLELERGAFAAAVGPRARSRSRRAVIHFRAKGEFHGLSHLAYIEFVVHFP